MVDKIKKESNMTFVASTISEHIYHEALVEAQTLERARWEERIKRAEAETKQA